MEDVTLYENLVVLNAHFSTHRSFTLIDLTMSSGKLLITEIISKLCFEKIKTKRKFRTYLTNWDKFRSIGEKVFNTLAVSNNINQEVNNVAKIVRVSANILIPQSKCLNKSCDTMMEFAACEPKK